MSPDWSGAGDPVPYADLENPQTLNLYSYVQNNPLTRRDPFGHADPCQGIPNCVSVTADPPPIISTIISGGHHFIDQAVIKSENAWNSLAGQVFRRWTTGPLKPGGVHSGFPKAARLSQEQIRKIVDQVNKLSGKNSMAEWGEAEINEAKQLVANDGGDTGAFLKDIAAENPGARTAQQDIGDIIQAGQKAWQGIQSNSSVQQIEQGAEWLNESVIETEQETGIPIRLLVE